MNATGLIRTVFRLSVVAIAAWPLVGCLVDDQAPIVIDSQRIERAAQDPAGAAKEIVKDIIGGPGGSENEKGGVDMQGRPLPKPTVLACQQAEPVATVPAAELGELSGFAPVHSGRLGLQDSGADGGIVIDGDSGTSCVAGQMTGNACFVTRDPVSSVVDFNTRHCVKLACDVEGEKFDIESYHVVPCGAKLTPSRPERQCLLIFNSGSAASDPSVMVYGLGTNPANALEGAEFLNRVLVQPPALVVRETGQTVTFNKRLDLPAVAIYPYDNPQVLHPERAATAVFFSRPSADASSYDSTWVFALAPDVWRDPGNRGKKVTLEYVGEFPLLFMTAMQARSNGQAAELLAALPDGPAKTLATAVLDPTKDLTQLTKNEIMQIQNTTAPDGKTFRELFEAAWGTDWATAHENVLFSLLPTQAQFSPVADRVVLQTYAGTYLIDVDIFGPIPPITEFLALNRVQFIPAVLPQTETMYVDFEVDGTGKITKIILITGSEAEQRPIGTVVPGAADQPLMRQECAVQYL